MSGEMNDVRAAAERLLKFEKDCNFYGWPTRFDRDLFMESLTFVSIYLAEHPADELLEVDENWLLAIGFMRVANGLRIGSQFHGRHHLRYANVFRHDDGQWWANGLGCSECKTRSDVRRLCKALGVTVR